VATGWPEKGTAPISLKSYRRLGRSLIAIVLAMHVSFLWSIRARVARGDPDFTVYFTAAKMLREGRRAQLYDVRAQQQVQREFTTNSDIRRGPLPYIHLPFEALLFLPLTFLSYPTAFVLWNVFNLVMLVCVIVLLRGSLVSLRKVPLLDCVLASLAFFPILGNFHQGQDGILLLLDLVLGFRALERDADFAAGCWLGLGIFKFQFLIPVALVLALWRGKKLAFGFTIVASAALALSIALVGWHGAMPYPAFAWRVVSQVPLGGLPFRLMPNLMGLINGWPILEGVGWPLRMLALAGSAVLLGLVAGMKVAARDRGFFNLCLACAVIAAVTVSSNTNTYDLSVLILPIALCVDYGLRAPDPERTLKAVLLPALPVLISPLWFFLWLRWARTNLMAICLVWWIYAIWREIQRLRVNRNSGELISSSSNIPSSSPSNPQPEAIT